MSLARSTKNLLSKQASKRYIQSGVFTQASSTYGAAGLFDTSQESTDLVQLIQGFIDDGLISTAAGTVTSVVASLAGTILTVDVNGVSDTEDLSSLGGGVAASAISPASNDITGAVGTSTAYAREDHKHPSDATKLSVGVPSGEIIVGSAGNVGTPIAMTGDVSITDGGVTTVVTASNSVAGKIEIADSTEATGGTATDKAMTPFTTHFAHPAKSALTTKGDIYVASAVSNPIRLAAGTDNYALVADSTENTGLKYDKIKWSEPLAVVSAPTTASGTNLETIRVNSADDLTLNGSDYNTGDLVRVVNQLNATNDINGDQSFFKLGAGSSPYVQPAYATTTFQLKDGGGWDVVAEVSETESGLLQYTTGDATFWATGLGCTVSKDTVAGVVTVTVPSGVDLKRINIAYSNTDTDDTNLDLFVYFDIAGARTYNTSYSTAVIPNGYLFATDDTLPIGSAFEIFHLGRGSNDRLLLMTDLATGDGSDIGFQISNGPAVGLNNMLILNFDNF